MKARSVRANNRKHQFEVATARGWLPFPYAECDVIPSAADPIVELFVDPEIAREGFTFVLASGAEDTILVDQVLHHNRDPRVMRDLLLYDLSIEAQRRLAACALSKREVIRRLNTSPAQFYRLLDQTNYRKTVDRMLELLSVLDCDVSITVEARAR